MPLASLLNRATRLQGRGFVTVRSVAGRRAAFMVGSPAAGSPAAGSSAAGRAATRAVRLAHTPVAAAASVTDGQVYRRPPAEVASFVERPESPGLTLSPHRDLLLYLHRPSSYPPVSELARAEVKLAGLRIDVDQNSRSRMGFNTALEVAPLPAGQRPGVPRPITGIPPGSWLNFVSWSPNGRRIAFTVRGSGLPGAQPRGPLELWAADVDTCVARPVLPGYVINSTFEEYTWIDENTLLAAVVPADRGQAPERPATPAGPRISVSAAGVVAQARTYPDLLKDSHDCELFAHLCSSQLVRVTLSGSGASGSTTAVPWGRGATSRIYTRMDPSPDGLFTIVEYLEPPFSYLVPAGRFPKRVELWRTADGSLVRTVAALPLAESIPIVNDSCRTGPRTVSWRSDAPATLVWAEAQDGGDPRVDVPVRDIIFYQHAASSDTPAELLRTQWRFSGIAWGDNHLALAYESQYKSRSVRTWAFAPSARVDAPSGNGSLPPALRLFNERNYEDAYNDPGSPATRRLDDGSYVLAVIEPPARSGLTPTGEVPGRKLLFQGTGACPEGYRPFMDVVDVDTGSAGARLFQSGGAQLEYPSSIVSDAHGAPITLDSLRILSTRETPTDVAQYHVLTFDGRQPAVRPAEVQISAFPHPHPQLVAPPKEIIRYKRADGVDLSATLYTPPGWRAGVDPPLPCLFWAYPREFKTKEAAGQLRDSPHRFTSIGALSPLVWLARGYAVLDGPTLPIIADGDGEPNDTYVEQLVAGAQAAVDEVVRRGVADPRRIAVGGRSYGAFMTANLLAHCGHLFACGVAQAGAYNRTLTPFGFQAEERTLWQAPDIYSKMSPFMHADKIKTPLLLIHGEEDTNTGTFPIQSERFFGALKGHGAECRLVLLPHESHSYRGEESVLHILAEMSDWLDKYTATAGEPSSQDAPALAAR